MVDVKDLKVTYTADSSHYDALKGITFMLIKEKSLLLWDFQVLVSQP